MGYYYYGITRPTTIKKNVLKIPHAHRSSWELQKRSLVFCLEESERPHLGHTSTLPGPHHAPGQAPEQRVQHFLHEKRSAPLLGDGEPIRWQIWCQLRGSRLGSFTSTSPPQFKFQTLQWRESLLYFPINNPGGQRDTQTRLAFDSHSDYTICANIDC